MSYSSSEQHGDRVFDSESWKSSTAKTRDHKIKKSERDL